MHVLDVQACPGAKLVLTQAMLFTGAVVVIEECEVEPSSGIEAHFARNGPLLVEADTQLLLIDFQTALGLRYRRCE